MPYRSWKWKKKYTVSKAENYLIAFTYTETWMKRNLQGLFSCLPHCYNDKRNKWFSCKSTPWILAFSSDKILENTFLWWNFLFTLQQCCPCNNKKGNRKQERTKIYSMMGCSPSSSEMTINESVNLRDRGFDLARGLITCNITRFR